MIESLRLGKVGDGEQVLGLEIGDDDGGAVLQDLLGLGDDVAVGREDVFDEIVLLAEKLAALVVVLRWRGARLATPLSVRIGSTSESGTGSS